MRWCLQAGVAQVSLYDNAGELVRVTADIATTLATRLGASCEPSTGAPGRDVAVRVVSDAGEFDVRVDGAVAGEEVRYVFVLGPSNSHGEVVKALRAYCDDVQAGKVAAGDVARDSQLLRRHMMGGEVITQPNLLLTLGSRDSVLGFPPWLLRRAEIAYASELQSLSQAEFEDALRAYAHVEQRFGR